MTEKEWLACTDPAPMLEFLRRKTSDRKMRLWGCACCRRIWGLLSDTGRMAIEATEAWAVGRVSGGKLDRISRQIYSEIGPYTPDPQNAARRYAAAAVWNAAEDTAYQVTHTTDRPRPVGAWGFAIEAMLTSTPSGELSVLTVKAYETQCELLRDIIGSPFRPGTLDPAILTWNDATVVRLAQANYDQRQESEGVLDNDRLAILADALEEAGCIDTDILNHCRQPGPHVRGCWVVDLLLGKH
jgi:hypothetical protein